MNRAKLVSRLRVALGNTEEARAWEHLLNDTSTILCTPRNTSTFETGVGIRQDAVESPLLFAALTEWVIDETVEEFKWTASVSTYPDLELTQSAYMDDVILWEGTTTRLQQKVIQLQSKFLQWGLKLNIAKCVLYTSPKHVGPRKLVIDGIELASQDSLNVMGVEFRVGAGVFELLQGTWQRAKQKFWSISHLLRANTPISGRLHLLNRVVGASALWNSAAFSPEQHALEAVNHLLYQFVVWMLRPRKHSSEDWVTFKQSTIRQARVMVLTHIRERWSTQWLARWWGYSGHTARGLNQNYVPGSSIINNYRNLEWWTTQQNLIGGARHAGRFRAKLAPLDRSMSSLFEVPWREAACNRELWGSKCQQWIINHDVVWNSGQQFSIEW